MLVAVFVGFFAFSEAFYVHPEHASGSPFEPVSGYHDYNEMSQFLSELSHNYSKLSFLYTIGQTVGGKELWVLRLTSDSTSVLCVPQVKFVGNIHGNEPVGRELILYFAEYLLRNYETDSEVNWLLENTVIHLLPSLNPDGFERSKEGVCYSGPGRENGNYIDLNRSFPDHLKDNRIPAQPETLAVSQWMSKVPFILSASFHGGALVANYPFDSNFGNDSEELMEELMKNITRGENLMEIWKNLTPNEREILAPHSSPTPDDDVFKHLAQTYANNHQNMHKGRTCNENQPSFPGGITNGAAWYSFTGGMQDYNYVSHGCMELTLEISCCKYPQSNHLPRLWAENKRAMMELVKQSHMGVKGLVTDKLTSAYISGAKLHISGRSVPFYSSINGEFWRILLPGDYILIVEAKGYETQSFPFTVRRQNESYPTPTWVNVHLQPVDNVLGSASSNRFQAVENSAAAVTLTLPAVFILTLWNFS